MTEHRGAHDEYIKSLEDLLKKYPNNQELKQRLEAAKAAHTQGMKNALEQLRNEDW